jgi:sugar transferase (PEP-CTERM/EpsH1 system associated)
MEELLYLVHRIPYPPNKGDKIRSYHLLKHLARRYRVHVGAFVDDQADWVHADALRALAGGEIQLLPLSPSLATLRSVAGFLAGEPLTLPYYRDARMQGWIDSLLGARDIRLALAYSSSMAQYLPQKANLKRVIDFVDIDSDKWQQYAARKSWPMRWIYRREAQRLLAYEQVVCQDFDATVFVSDAEADLFKRLMPAWAHKVVGISNGVDTEYFSPLIEFMSPFAAGERTVVFTGAMDYWANIDAVTWFAKEVFGAVRGQVPAARFYIVGARPTAEVQALAAMPGVEVTGTVADVRPYLAHADLVVAPLRIARGIQNKVLEAMAMAKPTIVTPEALEGISARVGEEILLARDRDEFRDHCLALLNGGSEVSGTAARERVLSDYGWDRHLAALDRLLADAPLDGGGLPEIIHHSRECAA